MHNHCQRKGCDKKVRRQSSKLKDIHREHQGNPAVIKGWITVVCPAEAQPLSGNGIKTLLNNNLIGLLTELVPGQFMHNWIKSIGLDSAGILVHCSYYITLNDDVSHGSKRSKRPEAIIHSVLCSHIPVQSGNGSSQL